MIWRFAGPCRFLLLAFLACSAHAPDTESSLSDTAKAALVESGELQAVNSKMVSVPHFKHEFSNNGRVKLIWLEKEGTVVNTGDVVARLDTSNIKRVVSQKEADLNIAYADLEKLKVEQNSKLRELMSDHESAAAALQRAQIDLQRATYESEATKEIRKIQLEMATIEVEKAENKISHTRRIHKEELLIQQEKIKQIEAAIANAEHTIRRFALRAPASGMVEYRRNRRTRQKVRVGDEFWRGRPLIGLPDLSEMRVETTVNETDISKVRLGQKVIVRLDAYPKVAFEGKISSISITCHEKEEKSLIKVFDIEVLLNEADALLKPGMTVSCEILEEDT